MDEHPLPPTADDGASGRVPRVDDARPTGPQTDSAAPPVESAGPETAASAARNAPEQTPSAPEATPADGETASAGPDAASDDGETASGSAGSVSGDDEAAYGSPEPTPVDPGATPADDEPASVVPGAEPFAPGAGYADAGTIATFWRDTKHRVGIERTGVVTGATPLGAIPPPAWSFGDSPRLADELLDLVLSGAKTATTTAVWEYEAADEPAPRRGDVSIVLDGAGQPVALIRTTRVTVVAFDNVTAEFAAAEGEGDGTLASWRAEHETYFRRVLPGIGREFTPDMPVVCEHFELRYPDPRRAAALARERTAARATPSDLASDTTQPDAGARPASGAADLAAPPVREARAESGTGQGEPGRRSTPASTPEGPHMGSIDLAVIPGDGIGPEVVEQGLKVLRAALEPSGTTLRTTEYDLGAARWHRTGQTLTDQDLAAIGAHEAILLGAVGDPGVPSGVLERGLLLRLRFELDQYVNLRPSRLYPGVTSPLADPGEVDFVVVREGTEGPYVGNGGALRVGTDQEIATEVSVNTAFGVRRVVRYAFAQAAARPRHSLTLVHKHNVLVHAGHLWRRTVEEIGAEFPQVQVDYLHVDAATIFLATDPARFDVIVTDNLFGDILTDLAGAVVGGIGLAASGNVNPDRGPDGRYLRPSMFEPVHGSAPDIAGKGVADPTATVLSVAMLLDHLGRGEAADAVRAAVAADLAERGSERRSTAEVGDAVVDRLRG